MNSDLNEPEPPTRQVTYEVSMASVEGMPAELVLAFSRSLAEAQMLEHALKLAISNDIAVFVPSPDLPTYLDILAKVTLGEAKNISIGHASKKEHKQIADHVGFFVLVKMQWAANKRTEKELDDFLKTVVKERNRVAHSLLAECITGSCSSPEAIVYLGCCAKHFFDLRLLVTMADSLSPKIGSIAADGSILARLKTTG